MTDEQPPGQDLDALAAALRADAGDIRVFFQALCVKLVEAMPGAVRVERERGLLKKDRPVKKVTVSVGGDVFEAELRAGAVTCRQAHAVRGITLRSEEVGFDEWIRALVDVLAVQAKGSAAAHAALRSLVT